MASRAAFSTVRGGGVSSGERGWQAPLGRPTAALSHGSGSAARLRGVGRSTAAMAALLVCVTLEGTNVEDVIREAGRATVAGADLVEVRFDRLWVEPPAPEPETTDDEPGEGTEEGAEGEAAEAAPDAPEPVEEDEEGSSMLKGDLPGVDPLAGLIGLGPGERHRPLDAVDVADTIERLKSGIELPVVLTCRPEGAGGCYPGDEAGRQGVLLAAIESGVTWVDLEVEMDGEARSTLVAAAESAGTRVIASHHDLERTPEREEIIEFIEEHREDGTIIKCAYRCKDPIDGLRIVEAGWSLGEGEHGVALMGMGPSGDWVRLHAPVMGQSLVYAVLSTDFHLHQRGQVNVKELRQAWDVLEYF